MKSTTEILKTSDIEQKIKRLAYEILEDNYEEKEIVFIGIKPNGFVFANKIKKVFSSITDIKSQLFSIQLDKINPLSTEINYDFSAEEINSKVVILVDDVANSGKTLCYALKPLLQFQPKKIQVAVLVDRKHKSYPIIADYVGLSLSTTMKEQILVHFKKNESVVTLQ
jgi:pyrimidine operon attenuation protein/uracil phosphoribosyltransferase